MYCTKYHVLGEGSALASASDDKGRLAVDCQLRLRQEVSYC